MGDPHWSDGIMNEVIRRSRSETFSRRGATVRAIGASQAAALGRAE